MVIYYSRNEFRAAIQSYIATGMINPARTMVASCQGNAYDFFSRSIAETIFLTPSSSSIRYGIFASRPAVSGVLMKPGWIIVTPTPESRRSMRRLSKYDDTAALLAQYAADFASPRYAARLEIATR